MTKTNAALTNEITHGTYPRTRAQWMIDSCKGRSHLSYVAWLKAYDRKLEQLFESWMIH